MHTLNAQILNDKITVHHNSDWSGTAILLVHTECATIQVAVAAAALLDLARKVVRSSIQGPRTAGSEIVEILRALDSNDARTAALAEAGDVFCSACGIELHGACHCQNDE